MKRSAIVCLLALAVTTGCTGLRPMLARTPPPDSGPTATEAGQGWIHQQLSGIAIDWIGERNGQILRAKLRDELGRDLSKPARYRLSLDLGHSTETRLTSVDQTAVWVGVTLHVRYTLHDGNRMIFQGQDRLISSFPTSNNVEEAYAFRVRSEHIDQELVIEAARRIAEDIARFFHNQAAARR